MLKKEWLRELAFAYIGDGGKTSQSDFFDDGESDDDVLSIEDAIKGNSSKENSEDYEEDEDEEFSDEDEDEEYEDDDEEEDDEEIEDEVEEDVESDSITIDGETYTKDQILDLKKKGMLQADYTRKTTELANQRKQFGQDLEMLDIIKGDQRLMGIMQEYFKQNGLPNGVQAVQSVSPQARANSELGTEVFMIKNDLAIEKMKVADPVFAKSETGVAEVYNIALEKNIPLEDAKLLWEGANKKLYFKDEKEIVKKTKKEIAEKQKKNKGKTRTLVSKGDTANKDKTTRLSTKESKMAEIFGLSPEEYVKYGSKSDYID